MSHAHVREQFSDAWPSMARTALRVAFGLIWVANAAFTWTSGFAIHYVGYLHNAAHGQPGWSAWWFNLWIWLVTPNADVFVWLTRAIETALAAALLLGFARKTIYALGALFSLLIWSTAEGFGGPYTVGATNMGAGIIYVLVFIALVAISRTDPSPYSIDYYIEQAWARRHGAGHDASGVLARSGTSVAGHRVAGVLPGRGIAQQFERAPADAYGRGGGGIAAVARIRRAHPAGARCKASAAHCGQQRRRAH